MHSPHIDLLMDSADELDSVKAVEPTTIIYELMTLDSKNKNPLEHLQVMQIGLHYLNSSFVPIFTAHSGEYLSYAIDGLGSHSECIASFGRLVEQSERLLLCVCSPAFIRIYNEKGENWAREAALNASSTRVATIEFTNA
ncbi:MAG: hypothetical protein ACRC1W_12825 [Shewanella sp.]